MLQAIARWRDLLMDRLRAAVAALRLLRAASARDACPVLVYQMGKVGSTAVHHALRQHEPFVSFQVHRINRQNMVWDHVPESGRYFSWVLPFIRRVPVVTLVREPLGRNVSAWFENNPAESFSTHFLDDYPHGVPTEWFDVELAAALGVDVYGVPFDHERGWVRIDHDKYPTLVMRSDIPDPEKSRALEAHLGDRIRVGRTRMGANREYAETYRSVKQEFRYPAELAGSLLRSRYARHFFTPQELEDLWERWVAER